MNGQDIKITGMRPEMVLPANGGTPVHGYRVEFVTPSGVHTYAHVERGHDFPDRVRDAVMTEATHVEAAMGQFPPNDGTLASYR